MALRSAFSGGLRSSRRHFGFLQFHRHSFTMPSVEIRAVKQDDVPALEAVIASTELFPRELLAPMLAEYFTPAEGTEHHPRPMWLALVDAAHSPNPIGVAYATYETLTDNTWNLLHIAIAKSVHGKGYGTQLISKVEQIVQSKNAGRMLLVETSGTDEFAATRRFTRNEAIRRSLRSPISTRWQRQSCVLQALDTDYTGRVSSKKVASFSATMSIV